MGQSRLPEKRLASPLDNVIGKVVEEARLENVALIESGFEEAEKILKDTERDAKDETKKILQTADRQVESRSRQILGRAEIEGRNKTLRLVEEKINEAFSKALENLREKRGKDYIESLRKMIDEGVDSIEAEKVNIRCNKEDRATVVEITEEIAKKTGKSLTISDQPLQSSGGVQVETADGTISIWNTFEDRLERMKPELRRSLANLFLK